MDVMTNARGKLLSDAQRAATAVTARLRATARKPENAHPRSAGTRGAGGQQRIGDAGRSTLREPRMTCAPGEEQANPNKAPRDVPVVDCNG